MTFTPFRSAFVLLGLGTALGANADYTILVAGATFGNNTAPYANGVIRYKVNAAGVATPASGIAADQVVDPAGLAVSSTGELYVGNRNGNTNLGSVSIFHYNSVTDAYVADGSFSTGANGTHGIAFSPTTGEMFAANVNGPVTRFVGTTANGTLNSGEARDVFLSSNGQYAYVTQGINGLVEKFSVASGNLLNTFSVPGASGLHFGSWLGSDLYVADYGSGHVYDLTFNGTGDITTATSVVAADASIGVGFSPDGTEMFVPGHTTGVVSRFLKTGGVWTANGTITTGIQMGDIQIVPGAAPVPEPATLAALAVGFAALARRRRRA